MTGIEFAGAAEMTEPRGLSMTDDLCRKSLFKALESLTEGRLTLIDPAAETPAATFGGSAAAFPTNAIIHIHHPRFYRRAVLGGSVGVAESYMDGDWTADNLTAVIRIAARNQSLKRGIDKGWGWMNKLRNGAYHLSRLNTKDGSRRNIAAHYDLSNDFFALFLDTTMTYSSAFFAREDMTLAEGSVAKIDLTCRKLDLQPEDHLLEIGAGWGALAIHAARHYGCRVTTTTISREQHKYAVERVKREGLEDRVTVHLTDYRDLTGKYDKIVSIEMIEAVGSLWLKRYMERVGELLKPEGMALIQAITIPDQEYARAAREADFIKRYIFPGGFLPSISAICGAAGEATDLRLIHLHDFGQHYARTLRHWRERFMSRIGRVHALGMDDRFVRMWEYYLCYCEGAFEERSIGVSQLLFAKPLCRRRPVMECV